MHQVLWCKVYIYAIFHLKKKAKLYSIYREIIYTEGIEFNIIVLKY